jgi:EAL and modified HD-GYP domain-containing signal transduction protein
VNPVSAEGAIPGESALAVPGQRYVARQPVLDRMQKVFGYELLFRDGLENCFRADPEVASRSTLDSTLLFGMNTLCDGRRAFVNCTRDVLFKDLVTLLPPDQTVAEILDTVEPGDRVIAVCKQLKDAGYLIALDDFAPNDPRISLCDFADIIKIDFRATKVEERAGLMRRFGTGKRQMLAEKLDSPGIPAGPGHGLYALPRLLGHGRHHGSTDGGSAGASTGRKGNQSRASRPDQQTASALPAYAGAGIRGMGAIKPTGEGKCNLTTKRSPRSGGRPYNGRRM